MLPQSTVTAGGKTFRSVILPALGTFFGGAIALGAVLFPGLVWGLLDEEKLLKRDLPGYVEYAQQVRHRLVPYLW